MPDFFWPGDERASDHLGTDTYLRALVEVEVAWLDILGRPVDSSDLSLDPDVIGSGNGTPVFELVERLRDRLDPDTARWVHRGLTSQDVVDSALMLMLRDTVEAVRGSVREQVGHLADLCRTHRDTPMAARTLTQHAVPTTFGVKVATWLGGVLDAHDDLRVLTFPVQLGGAAGTSAALVELGLDVGVTRTRFAERLGLAPVPPWHTNRRPVTRIGDALVACTDAWARIAQDVLVLGRPEIGEVSEGTHGGLSTMSHKGNPMQSVFLRRTGLTTPQLAATLHLAAADQVDERAAGGWHAEWDTLRLLGRRTLAAASHAKELLRCLEVHPDRMAATLAAAREDVRSEQRAMAWLRDREPFPDYAGEAGSLVDAVLDRARSVTEETS